MESNSTTKLKIIKTDELLGLYATLDKQLEETKQLYKTLRTKYNHNVSELKRVTIENERLTAKCAELESNQADLTGKFDSLKADHALLENKYSDLIIEAQLNLKTNQVYIDLNKEIEELKKAKRSCKVDDRVNEADKKLREEYERLLNDFAEKQSECAKLRGVLDGYEEKLGELGFEGFDLFVEQFVGLQEQSYRDVLEKDGLVEDLRKVREEVEVWRRNEEQFLKIINKRLSTVGVQTESDECCVHSMLFNVRPPDMISPMLSDIEDIDDCNLTDVVDDCPSIVEEIEPQNIEKEELNQTQYKSKPNIKIIQRKPIKRKMLLSRFHNYNEFKIRNLFLKKGTRRKVRKNKEVDRTVIYEAMMQLNKANLGFTISNMNQVPSSGHCINCKCGDERVKCETKNRDIEKLYCRIDACKCQSYMVTEGESLLGFIDIKKETDVVKKNVSKVTVSQIQTKKETIKNIVNTEETDLQITDNIVQLSIPDTSDIEDDFEIEDYVFPPPPLSPIASICGDENVAISPRTTISPQKSAISPLKSAISLLKSPPRTTTSPQNRTITSANKAISPPNLAISPPSPAITLQKLHRRQAILPLRLAISPKSPAITPQKSPPRQAISPLPLAISPQNVTFSSPNMAISPLKQAISPLKSPQPCDISNKPKKIQILQNVVITPPFVKSSHKLFTENQRALKRTSSTEDEESSFGKKSHNTTEETVEEKKKLSIGKTSQLFKKLISFPTEINVAEEVVDYLSSQDPLYISQLILEVASQDTLDLCTSNRPPNGPLLTETQMVLIGLMLKFEKKTGQTVLNHFLSEAELRLFTDPSIKQKIMSPICRMYFAICKMNFDLDRVRKFCCEAFYFMGPLAVPILFNLLTTWMEVLPHHSDCKEYPMARVLVYLVLTRPCPEVGYNLQPLIGLLTGHYGYPRDREDKDILFKDVYKTYVRKPNKLSSLTVLLLCKGEPANWVMKKVDSHFKPLVYRVQSDNFKATVLVLLGKMFKSISDVNVLKETRLWLDSLLEENSEERGSVLIKRAVEYCLKHFPTENA